MLKNSLLLACMVSMLGGCISYGHQSFVPSEEQKAQMSADSQRVQNTERAERAERRAERREEMMDEADAIKRAYGDRKIYILR